MISVATVTTTVVREAQMTRLSMSRPSLSVPKRMLPGRPLVHVVQVLVGVAVRRDERREEAAEIEHDDEDERGHGDLLAQQPSHRQRQRPARRALDVDGAFSGNGNVASQASAFRSAPAGR